MMIARIVARAWRAVASTFRAALFALVRVMGS
jgi:hypothetical protein